MCRYAPLLLVGIIALATSGAFAAEFSLWPQLQVTGGYNDNVANSATNPKGDFLSADSPGVTLQGSSPLRNFDLTYETLLLAHQNYSNDDRFLRDNYLGIQDVERLSRETTLTINESFLIGNAIGSGVLTGPATAPSSQLMQSLLSNSNTLGNTFVSTLASRYSDSFSWTANLHQYTSSSQSGNQQSKYSFGQGATIGGDWMLGERITAGGGYQFDDFRFSNGSVPTTESHTLWMRLGWGVGTPLSLLAQAGPVMSQTSSGTVNNTFEPSSSSLNAAFLVSAAYNGRRLSISGSFAQMPSVSAGFAGASTTAQTYSALLQYKLTRHTAVFLSSGYYVFNGAGSSGQSITYSGGISYKLSEMISLNAGYFGYSSSVNSSGSGSLTAAADSNTHLNMFLLGLTIRPKPFMWRAR